MLTMRKSRFPIRDPEKFHFKNRFGVKYEVGDMVWGKVKSHPWWPGQIYDEALASPIVNETKRDGHLLVAFFGDDTYGWFDPIKLIPFDLNYMDKSKQTNASDFVAAVQDAENEICRRAAIGLSCCCRNTLNFKAIGATRFFQVDVEGYGTGVYTGKQLESVRNGFQPTQMLCFLKGLALMPCCEMESDAECIKNEAVVLAYRKAVFREFGQTYPNSFQIGPQGTCDSSRILDRQENFPFEASPSCSPEKPESPSRIKCLSRTTEVITKKFGGTNINLSRDGTADEAATINKKPVLEQIISNNLLVDRKQLPQALATIGSLENLVAVGKTLPLSSVASGAKVLETSCGHMDERKKVSNQIGEDLTPKLAVPVDKKKRKTEFKSEIGFEHSCKCLKSKVIASKGDANGKSFQTDLYCQDNKILGQLGRRNGAFYIKYEVTQLLHDLLAFALDPFHGVGMEQKALAVFLQFFQQYRSRMFLKNFRFSSSTEFELIKNRQPESLACNMTLKRPFHEDSLDVPPASKPQKKRFRPDDCEKFDKNISNSGRKEGRYVKRLIKLSKLKSLSAVNNQKPFKSLAIHEKGLEKDSTEQGKDLIKKHKTSIGSGDHTMLVIVFPHLSALPSVSEMKARFARFGPLHSVPRLFWKSSTCQIVFKYKCDACVAYRYVYRNKFLFGDAKVNCYLEAVEVAASKLSNPGKHQVQEDPDSETGDHTEKLKSKVPHEQYLSHSKFQPKSCLKKSLGPKVDTGALRIKHVRFRLNEDQSSSDEKHLVTGSVKNSSMIQPIASSSLSCHSTAEVPGNCQVLIAKSPPALDPLLNQIASAPRNHELDHFVATCNAQYEVEVRNNIYSTPNTFNVDISSQMLNLMTRCSEIVTDLKCWLGYMPIHL